ncbi:Dbl homology domain-containing protein [Chlamydoabsidia padenii]|nr:Dbl homology domain-containing protein [Chlamydoabsidia padenii]
MELSYTFFFVLESYQSVFIPLSKCYAPRCTRNQTCYSISCPNKIATPTTTTNISIPSKIQPIGQQQQQHALWIHSVPRTIVSTTLPAERYRQEAIYELIQTEVDFVGHLRYIKKFWIEPLELKDTTIVRQVFWNWLDVLRVNTGLMDTLVTRQQQDHRITHVGPMLLAHVGQFEPFIVYGSHQLVGKFYLELQKKRSSWFAQFVKETEQRPESERLELNGYLTKVTTRLARYPILLNNILHWTPANHPDHESLGRVLEILGQFLQRLDHQVGLVSHQFELEQFSERLVFNKFTHQQSLDFDLKSPHRRLVHQGRMQRTSLDGDIQVFLFDHLLVFTKVKIHHHLEYYRPFGKWIPLEHLTFALHDQVLEDKKAIGPTNGHLLYLITFQHKNQVGSTPITLVTPNEISRRNWVEKLTRTIDKVLV